MKAKLTLIATVVAALFTGIQPALAANTHENEWGKIQLCDKLTIADDSAGGWGCWTEFAPPAAGPSGIGFLGMNGGELYVNSPVFHGPTSDNPTTPTDGAGGCPAGAACGYAVYRNYDTSYVPPYWEDHYVHEWVKTKRGWQLQLVNHPIQHSGYWTTAYNEGGDSKTHMLPATFSVTPSFGETGMFGGPMSASFLLTQLNPDDPAPTFTASGNLPDGWYLYIPGWFGYGTASSNSETGGANIEGTVTGHDQVAVGGNTDSFRIYVYLSGQTEKTLCGDCQTPQMGVEGAYVVGYPTSANDMAAMATKIGYYQGNEVLSGAWVNIQANFSTAAWNGSWNGGNLPSWGAAGTINGANIQSTSVNGHAVAGSVQGTFYGSGANNLAGVSDVTLQKGESQVRHVDLFVTDLKFAAPAAGTPQ